MTRTMQRPSERPPAVASGLVVFAAVMLVIGGLLDVFRGISAIAEDEIFVSTPNYIFEFDVTGWGWIHLVLGALAVIVGISLFRVTLWSRVVAVAIAGLLLITSFLSLPSYPFWSVIMIALYGFVIWALCVVRPDY